MKPDEAKFILSAYRPHGRDAGDYAYSEALKLADADPNVGRWLQQQQTFDSIVGEKLATLSPPPGLRESILAGARVGGRRVWWRQPRLLAVAACMAVLALVSPLVWWAAVPIGGSSLQEYAMNYASRPFMLMEHSKDMGRLKAWLASRNAPQPGNLPGELARLEGLGCKTIEYQGKKISLVCFDRNGMEYHLFVARRSDFSNLAAALQMRSHGKWGSASWGDAEHQYVLVSAAGSDAVRSLLL
ncbi:MAG TPA: hypothetical protein VIT91_06225 [Chthoniobacterales bacterium]